MPAELYKICALGKGALYVMPKPSSDNLHQDISFYQSRGVTKLVSLLLPREIEELAMTEEPKACLAQGLKFSHFAIKDMSVPNIDDLQVFNQRLKEALSKGEHIAIHCHGGRGRAGIVAITLMIDFGYDANSAIEMASEARGDRMPVNDIQLEFVKSYVTADS